MMNTDLAHIRLPLNRLSDNPIYKTFTRPLTKSERDDLKASIRSVGTLLVPIIVEFVQAKNSYDIVDGYHRRDILIEPRGDPGQRHPPATLTRGAPRPHRQGASGLCRRA